MAKEDRAEIAPGWPDVRVDGASTSTGRASAPSAGLRAAVAATLLFVVAAALVLLVLVFSTRWMMRVHPSGGRRFPSPPPRRGVA